MNITQVNEIERNLSRWVENTVSTHSRTDPVAQIQLEILATQLTLDPPALGLPLVPNSQKRRFIKISCPLEIPDDGSWKETLSSVEQSITRFLFQDKDNPNQIDVKCLLTTTGNSLEETARTAFSITP